MGVVSAETLETVSSDAALRALSEQEGALRDLRARAGTLLTAASLTVSFLGAQAIDREGLGVLGALAVAAFVVSLLTTLYVLMPKEGLIFALDGPELYEALYEVRGDLDEIHRRLTYWVASFRGGNHSTIQQLYSSFKLATWALIAQVLLWTAHLTSIV